MMPHADLAERLTTVPGIDKVVAWTLISEMGADMSPFPNAGHLASWAGLCPGNNESAGKRKSGRTRKGNRYLKHIMVQAAWAAAHTKNTFLSASFFRLARRQGTGRLRPPAARAVSNSRDASTRTSRGESARNRLDFFGTRPVL